MRETDLTLGLDIAVEYVKKEFRARTSGFNNSQSEYVCQHLTDYFKGKLKAIRNSRRTEDEKAEHGEE